MTESPKIDGLTPERAERLIYEHILTRNPEHDFEPTLDRMRDACALLGDPQRTYRVVHLTGTNGKTSTARMTESLVRAHGLRTGLFTSPHLTSVRERIQIDGEPISREAFIQLWRDVSPIIELADARSAERGGPRLSFFEVFTVLAFAAFADAPIDVAIVEVGLGGSWDATNVADGEVAVIAPIALDHTRYLGTDVVAIAREKSGIVKPGATVVIAEQVERVTPVLIEAIAAAKAEAVWEGDQIEVLSRDPAVGGQVATLRTAAGVYEGLFIPLFGEHQAHNALLALAATEALLGDGTPLHAGTVEEGFAQATSPGRLEVVRTSPLVMVDAAHNPHGVAALADALEESFALETIVGVVGILDDKDAAGMLGALEPVIDRVVITASLSPRSRPADQLADLAREIFGRDRVSLEPHLPDALDRAIGIAEAASERGGGVIVTGSITLVAEVRTLMGADNTGGAS